MPLEFFLLMNFWPRGFYGNRAKEQEREDVSGDEDRPSLGQVLVQTHKGSPPPRVTGAKPYNQLCR